jgi:hypothetical protein
MELAMDRADIEKELAWLKPRLAPRATGRRIKVYVAPLNRNFYLENASSRRPSSAVWNCLAHGGITKGWKKGAEVHPRDVDLWKLNLLMLAHSRDGCSH